MTDLLFHWEAEDELESLYETDEATAALMDVLFETICESPNVLSGLFRANNHFNHEPPFEIKEYRAMHKMGLYIMTIKPMDGDGHRSSHRALLGYDGINDNFYVLAIAHREVVYDTNDQLFTTVQRRYAELDIPTYPTN